VKGGDGVGGRAYADPHIRLPGPPGPTDRLEDDGMAHGDITHIDIPVEDMDRAKSFYGTLFGWQINEVPGYEGYPMWRAPNQISGGGLTAKNDSLPYPRSYIEVDSIDDTLDKATELGGTVLTGKQPISDTSWWAELQDSEGNRIGLYEGITEPG
jgi:predicted enzyme related to lactoylglutathione lyase